MVTAARNKSADEGQDRYSHVALKAYGPIAQVIDRYKAKITELSVNGPGDVRVRLAGEGSRRLPAREAQWATRDYFQKLCTYFAAANGILFDKRLPLVACRTPDGHRFQAQVGEGVETGISSSIRIKRKLRTEVSDFTDDPALADRLVQTVADGKSVVVSGGTGAGKTTLLNTLYRALPKHMRMFTIEDTRELELETPDWTKLLVARTASASEMTWAHQIDHAVRSNPDGLGIGELSIPSAFATVQAMDTGHESFGMTTHANTGLDALRGFRRRVALGGGSVGAEIADFMDFVADTLSMVVQIRHVRGGDGKGERRQIVEAASAKELLDRRDDRDAFAERETFFAKQFDLSLARDMLLAANAGEPLNGTQDEILRVFGILAAAKSDAPAPAKTPQVGGPILSPEERMHLAAADLGLTLAGGEGPPAWV